MNECMVCKLQEERNSHHLEFTFPAFPLKPVGCFFKKHYSKFNLGFLNLSKWKIICLLSLCCLATLHTQSVISRYFYLEPISMLGLVSFRKYCCPKGLGSNFLSSLCSEIHARRYFMLHWTNISWTLPVSLYLYADSLIFWLLKH